MTLKSYSAGGAAQVVERLPRSVRPSVQIPLLLQKKKKVTEIFCNE
jgi:hypothetical protein